MKLEKEIQILLYSSLSTKTYHNALGISNFFSFFKIWQIWVISFHEKSLAEVEIIFSRSNFGENSPIKKNTNPVHKIPAHYVGKGTKQAY